MGTMTGDTHAKPISYANVLNEEQPKKKFNFRSLKSNETVSDADLAIPMTSVEEVNNRFANTLYGYFIGNYEGIGASARKRSMADPNGSDYSKHMDAYPRLIKEDITSVPVWVKKHSVLIVGILELVNHFYYELSIEGPPEWYQRVKMDSLSAKHQPALRSYSSQRHRQRSRRLLEEILVSWDEYQLIGNNCKINSSQRIEARRENKLGALNDL
nr:hypothetical protein [Tanacetum cinerariifolium]